MDYKIWKIIEKIKSRKTKFDINCLEKSMISSWEIESEIENIDNKGGNFFFNCKDIKDKQDRNSILISKTSKDNQIRKRL